MANRSFNKALQVSGHVTTEELLFWEAAFLLAA